MALLPLESESEKDEHHMKRDRELDQSWFHWLAFCAVVFASVLFVFGRALQFYFWQDDFYLLEFVGQKSLVEYVRVCFTKPTHILPLNLGVVFRPMTHYLYFKICRILFGLEPSLYRLPIIFVLFFSGILVARYCQLITRRRAYGFVAGVIFVINRAHFTPVYWITSSHEIVVTCFMLLSVIGFLQSLDGKAGESQIYNFISLLSLVFALLSKENAVVLPALIVLSVFLRSGSDPFRNRLLACRRLWLHCLIVLVFLAVRIPLVVYALDGGGDSYYALSRLTNLVTSYLWGFWWHLETFVEPWRMILDGLTQSFSLFQPLYVSTLGVLLSAAGAIWLIRREGNTNAANPIWLGLAWFVISAAPALVTGILSAYLFSLPAVGFAMVIAYLVVIPIIGTGQESTAKRWLPLVILLLLGIVSARLVVFSLETSTWPVKHMPLAAQTLEAAQRHLPNPDSSQTVCLVDFPTETWWPGKNLQPAFHVFFDPKTSVRELTAEEVNGGGCPLDAPQLRYVNGEIVYQPSTEDQR